MTTESGGTVPLPNEHLHAGDLCPSSFAWVMMEHVRPAEHDGWGVCLACGETVNTRGSFIPEHRIPAHTDRGTDG